MAMSANIVGPVVAAARKRRYDENAALACVEIESGGRPIEPADGRTPELLFERHWFYRLLPPEKRAQALQDGLTYGSTWDKSRQYKDQGTSANRLALLKRARDLDEEAANGCCSWGIGQTMGFLWKELGFKSATDMVRQMTDGGIPVQVECMFREIDNKHLGPKMNAHDWAGFALVYNGKGYRQNQYDTRLAAAYARWVNTEKPAIPTQVPAPVKPLPPAQPIPTTPSGPHDAKGQPPANAGVKGGTGAVIAGAGAATVAAGSGMLSWLSIVGIVLIVAVGVGGFLYWKHHRDR